ncbi:efflux RND transporter permease subunit [Gangjinia marincola]|uniref:Efflux RND transporter permease subunit n=1 Tax=Gangjinia marincola TaxID=578463 RepID=A0ABN1MI90_9FLAO
MKNFIAYFIKYPVAVNIFIIGFFIFGYLGYQNLNSSFFPLADPSLITVSVTYPGASPQEVEEGVIEKIEKNLEGIDGIDQVTSVSQENLGTVTVEIFSDFDINNILDEVKNAVDRIASFPRNIEPPVVQKVDPVRESIVFSISADNVPLSMLKSISQEIEEDLIAIDGISQIALEGFPEEEIEIAVNEITLRNYNLSFDDISRAVSNSNILISGGSIKTSNEEYLIRADNKEYYANDFQDIVVKSTINGDKVLLKDVATIANRFSETPESLVINGNNAITFSVTNTNSEDLIGSAEKVKQYIENYNKSHDNIELTVITDSSASINDRISLLLENAIVGMILVLILLSFFLRPGVAFWVAFGLPISFFGMFIILGEFGVTLNMLSLFGMILVIGILVDDGIVIAENIYARSEKGDNPYKAAVRGTLDVLVPILSAIATTIIAFSVFFFLDGQIGAFFEDIAYVVILTLAVSLIEALLILPAHLAHSKDLKQGVKKKEYKFNVWGDKVMDFLKDKIYSPAFKFSLNNRFLSFAILLFLFILTIGGFTSKIIGVTFFPTNASDQVRITINTPQGTNERITDSIASYIEDKIWLVNKDLGKTIKDEDHIVTTIKKIGPGSSSALLTVNLAPSETRTLTSIDIANTIRTEVGKISGLEKLSFNSGANVGGSPISVSIEGKKKAQLDAAKKIIYDELEKNPGVKDIVDGSPEGIKEININLKENATLLGLTLNDVMGQVRSAFFGSEIQRVQRGEDEVKVWVRYAKENRSNLTDIDNIQIVTQNGRVPLSQIASYTIERGEVAINHKNGKREVTIEADVTEKNVNPNSITQDLTTRVAQNIQDKYPDVTMSTGGQSREVGKIVDSALLVIPAAIFLIYLIIVFAFRSYSQPLILLGLVPFSIIGVAWGHWIHGFPVNVLSYLGIIGLVGIVVNDGLVFTGKYNDFLKSGLTVNEALFETGKARFRAIFLTSITTIAGLAPLIFEKSLQAQFLIPMAISIAYGIAVATVLTLFILPIFLSFTNSTKVRLAHIFTGKKPSREDVERAIKEMKADEEEI